jgi:phosphate:Na+ symporter
MERATGRRHLTRLESQPPGGLDASTLHLAILRDLRRVNSHIAAVAYDVLGLEDPQEAPDETTANGTQSLID